MRMLVNRIGVLALACVALLSCTKTYNDNYVDGSLMGDWFLEMKNTSGVYTNVHLSFYENGTVVRRTYSKKYSGSPWSRNREHGVYTITSGNQLTMDMNGRLSTSTFSVVKRELTLVEYVAEGRNEAVMERPTSEQLSTAKQADTDVWSSDYVGDWYSTKIVENTGWAGEGSIEEMINRVHFTSINALTMTSYYKKDDGKWYETSDTYTVSVVQDKYELTLKNTSSEIKITWSYSDNKLFITDAATINMDLEMMTPAILEKIKSIKN